MSSSPPAGWYPDPNVAQQNRYWNGSHWTDHTAPTVAAPSSQPTPETPVETPNGGGIRRLTTPQRVSAIAMIVLAIAAFMPWASLFGISKIGVEGDGIITLILAIVGAGLLAFSTGMVGRPRSPGRGSQITLLVLALFVSLIGLLDMSGVAAIGLYLTFFAGVAWVISAIWQMARGGQSRPSRSG
jgi:hypothetical protein